MTTIAIVIAVASALLGCLTETRIASGRGIDVARRGRSRVEDVTAA
jgi:hypothetical protein